MRQTHTRTQTKKHAMAVNYANPKAVNPTLTTNQHAISIAFPQNFHPPSLPSKLHLHNDALRSAFCAASFVRLPTSISNVHRVHQRSPRQIIADGTNLQHQKSTTRNMKFVSVSKSFTLPYANHPKLAPCVHVHFQRNNHHHPFRPRASFRAM